MVYFSHRIQNGALHPGSEVEKCIYSSKLLESDLQRNFYQCKQTSLSNDMESCLNFFDISLR